MSQAPANVFVVAPTPVHWKELQTVVGTGASIHFHPLLEHDEVVHVAHLHIGPLLEKARQQLRDFDGSVDAIIAQWDFPTTLLAPILSREWGLRSPSVESVLQCGHKYYSRKAQHESIPEFTPRFNLVDPFEPGAAEKIDLPYPFWLKPVKAYASQLGFRVENRKQLDEALEVIRSKIERLAEPFDRLLGESRIDEKFLEVGGRYCIAEEYLSGVEIAHEGHVFKGQVNIHGTLDMIRREETFSRFLWPSQAPKSVLDRMADASTRFLKHIGFDNGCFNAEFFWNKEKDDLCVIEFNPRISQSHAPLCIVADGRSNHEVAVDVALGRKPQFTPGDGDYEMAAKFLDRTHKDGRVLKIPTESQLQEIETNEPSASVSVNVKEGQRLSELLDQDAYSYLVAEVFLGGHDEKDLLRKHRQILKSLPLEIEGVRLPDDLIGVND